MASARGDRRPCSHADCSGTMQFSREPLPPTPSMKVVEGQPGWVCSESPGHFTRDSDRFLTPSTVAPAPRPPEIQSGEPS